MKRSLIKILRAAPTCLLAALFLVVPFYAFITVWLGTLMGGYAEWRVLPEVLLVGLSCAAALLVLRNAAYRRQLQRDRLVWLAAAYAVMVVLYSLVAYLRHDVGLRAISQGFILDLRLPVAFLAAYVVAPHAAAFKRRQWRWLLYPALAVVIFGLLQVLVLPADALKHVGYGPQTVPAVTLVDQKAAFARAQSTLRGPNPLGAYLVVIMAALAAFFVSGRRRWLAGLFGLMTAAVIGYSYSRSAYIGACIAVAVTVWLLVGARYRRWLLAAASVLVVLFGTGLLLLRHNDQFQNVFFHTDETSRSSRSSNQARASALQAGTRELVSHPAGNGVGTAGPASVYSGEGTRITENYYLQIGQETGWFGLLLFLALNGLVWYRLWLGRRHPWAVVFLASGLGLVVVNFLSHAWTDPTLAYVWWLAAGLSTGSAILPTETPHKHGQKTLTSD